ncbi:CWF19-like protein 2 [Spea bombifrons]|uniref:CWF19-like protein 2 n=1 Tax=Spea bombifrons TaxID=233779 RepID=UPI00234B0D6C|nr:CWF19-like protein 2 [Spea bombifrons]XP_053312445.1 CWF19-like protein 2 [Spea bombifrons]
MSAYEGSFESSRSIDEKKESRRKAREQLLRQAQEEYEKEEKRKEQRRLRGEDTWMLNDVNERLEELQQEHSGKKKKKDKHKKSKKEKKKSRKQKAEKNEDSDGSSQDSEEEWVEANPSQLDSSEKAWKVKSSAEKESDPAVKRDDWMTLDFMSLKATSSAAIREEKQREKTLEREQAEALEKEKIQARELNPFWKDGGLGLPPEEGDVTSVKKAAPVEDGGLSWLRKSYQRMKEQSEREKRSLEDIVSERYGSMEIFESKMEAAEKAATQNSGREHAGGKGRWRKYQDNEPRRFVKPDGRSRDPLPTYSMHEKSTRRETGERGEDKARWERREFDKNRTESDRRRYQDRGGDVLASKSKPKFLKPTENDNAVGFKPQTSKPVGTAPELRKGFQKPVKDDPEPWRKTSSKGYREETQQHKQEDSHGDEKIDMEEKPDQDVSPRDRLQSQQKPSPCPETFKPPQVQILSEEEMNKLGAKIVKAELLGNMELASKLRSQLEEARQQSKDRTLRQTTTDVKSDREGAAPKEENEILLVRTDQSGRSWPVNATADAAESKGGRRKRQMVPTHVDKERVRYFHDDDNQSLRDLVQREKMGTAEDQNRMFMRMASKFMEKTDQDYYTLDDMFVSKAAKKERLGEEDERERQQAISQHRRLAARMEKCAYCFDNAELPKHLIIAIGAKVYLCLPNHVSLTEGHCLIVPCQHYTATTLLDEDIWNEIQMFRKALVKMFEARDLDCVFLESNISMKKRFHLVYECIPLPKEVGDMAPIYFKKAIMESDEEWSMNKKLIDLSSKDIRKSVPKGLPYFSVDFGLQGGFAHVVENEHKFPHYFGKEIIGGMLDLEPRVWRKALRENFEDQRKKVLQFAQWWKPFDFNKN